ncbi:hypothetical protein HRI_004637300 [Hibiscus trionum]|uniref:Uncharacterized protein n=1 Tax=Hibiscus trionum TaxID=183268 RepID=A0A9W7J6R0_HIBTR|nr:hypothetical protein HRI_004637300 [Hibiscus trionum]
MANDTLETFILIDSNQHTSRDPTNNNTRVLETVQVIPNATFAKPFSNISKIEVFDRENFKRWQERWIHANKVCRHTIIFTLSIELFDVYCSYKK